MGRRVAAALRGRVPEDVRVIEHDGESAGLLDCLRGADAVYLVDAAISGCAPGTIQCFDVIESTLPIRRGSASTHGLGLAEAIELARALHLLPRHCLVYLVEAGSFAPGAALSPAVAAAVRPVSERIVADIGWQAAMGEGAVIR